MIINNKKVDFESIAFDGCHKIYLIQDGEDLEDAKKCGYEIHEKNELKEIWDKSCDLRFIRTWKLELIVPQCEDLEMKEN